MIGKTVSKLLALVVLLVIIEMKRTKEAEGSPIIHIPRVIANNEFAKMPAVKRPYSLDSFSAQRQYATKYKAIPPEDRKVENGRRRDAKASEYLTETDKEKLRQEGPAGAWKDRDQLAQLYETIFQRFSTRLQDACDRRACSVCDRDFPKQGLKSVDAHSDSKIIQGTENLRRVIRVYVT